MQQRSIEQHIRKYFVEGTATAGGIVTQPYLPKCLLASEDEINTWISSHAKQYPTFQIIEHRLALLCSHLTVGTDVQYDNVPMFDECGWPMIENITSTPGLLADMRRSGRRCILSDFGT
jgi:hypothetical protein